MTNEAPVFQLTQEEQSKIRVGLLEARLSYAGKAANAASNDDPITTDHFNKLVEEYTRLYNLLLNTERVWIDRGISI